MSHRKVKEVFHIIRLVTGMPRSKVRQSDSKACAPDHYAFLKMQCNNRFFHMNSTMHFTKLFSSYYLICPCNNPGNGVLLHISTWWMLLIATAFSIPPSASLFSDLLSAFHFLSTIFHSTSPLALVVSDSTVIPALLPLYLKRPFMTCLLD